MVGKFILILKYFVWNVILVFVYLEDNCDCKGDISFDLFKYDWWFYVIGWIIFCFLENLF